MKSAAQPQPFQPRSTDEPLLKVDDLVRRWSVNRKWVWNRVYEGKLPHLKVCGALRFDPAVIRELEATNTHHSR